MSVAIRATNSRGLRVINCKFQGFETDIELNNVEDFVSQGNVFSKDDPSYLLKSLISSIEASNLTTTDKRELLQEIITFYSSGATNTSIRGKLINKIANHIGGKAVDLFVQLAAAVTAGLILRVV